MNYYLVKCKFGHVGRDKYLPLLVPVIAESTKKASEFAQKTRGVKKDHKDWCLEEPMIVSSDVYYEAKKTFHSDVYFEKHSRSRVYLFQDRLIDEPNYTRKNGIKTNTSQVIKRKDKSCIEFKHRKEQIIIKSLIQDLMQEMSSYQVA